MFVKTNEEDHPYRFNLLLLEDGEYYLGDESVMMYPEFTPEDSGTRASKLNRFWVYCD